MSVQFDVIVACAVSEQCSRALSLFSETYGPVSHPCWGAEPMAGPHCCIHLVRPLALQGIAWQVRFGKVLLGALPSYM
jgi:hypothetical protein